MSTIQPSKGGLQGLGDAASRVANLAPFYSIGGPTTHFAGTGAHPFGESGWGNKKSKLRSMGISEEDWMLRTAEDARLVDSQLKAYRAERLQTLEGSDKAVWVYATERVAEGVKEEAGATDVTQLKPSTLQVAPKEDEEALTPLPVEDDASKAGETPAAIPTEPLVPSAVSAAPRGPSEVTSGGSIVVETPEIAARNASKYNWGLGSWQPGVVKAAYEVSCIKSPQHRC